MIGLGIDLALFTGHWILSKTYNGVYYMAFGPPKDPVLQRLEKIEHQLENQNTPDHKFYWETKSNYTKNHWLVISQQEVIFQSAEKTEALEFLTQQEKTDQSHPCLVVQVDQEQHMFSI